jgi:mitochondrial translocator assembly and maintenance protein 41
MIKYGVIGLPDALRDLYTWSTLYVAGRLHKPVRWLLGPHCRCMEDALHVNRHAALAAATLMLPRQFDYQTLLATVVGLSYQGAHSVL